MPADQIQIKWKQGSGVKYQDSMDALKLYDTPPSSIKGAINLKGNYTRETLNQVCVQAQVFGIDASLSLVLSYASADSEVRFVGGVNIKGEFTREQVDQLIALAREMGLEPALVLTATWGNNVEVEQMQLFAPPNRT